MNPKKIIQARDAAIPSSYKHLLMTLCTYEGKSGKVYPSVGRLARDCGTDIRHIRRRLRDLETQKYITAEIRGNGRENSYLIHIEKGEPWKKSKSRKDNSRPESEAPPEQKPEPPQHRPANPEPPPLEPISEERWQTIKFAHKYNAPPDVGYDPDTKEGRAAFHANELMVELKQRPKPMPVQCPLTSEYIRAHKWVYSGKYEILNKIFSEGSEQEAHESNVINFNQKKKEL